MSTITNALPASWSLATNDELGEFLNGAAFKPTDWGDEGIPIVRIQNLTDPSKPYNKTLRELENRYKLSKGDILVSWSATLDVFVWDGPLAYVNQHIFKVEPSPDLDKTFVFYALKLSIQELLKSEHLHGTTMKHVNRKPFLAQPVPIPPLKEQHRIVEKIETLFARLDKGEEAVREVQKLLKRYRQSVLKAAVTGELTADWRAEREGDLENADQLLARVRNNLRGQWSGRGKFKEASELETDCLPELPHGWTWATLPMLGEFGRGKSKHRPRNDEKLYADGTYPFLQTGRVRNSKGRISKYDKLYNEIGLAQSKLWPAGTVCITIAANIAESGILDIDACFPDSVVGLVPHPEIDGTYVEMFIRTAKENLDRYAPATAQKNINLEILTGVAVPLPSFAEQCEIMSRIMEAFQSADAVESCCETELKRSASLRQSILKQAFSGKLVEQDPNDEPASELLARIKAAKADLKRSKKP